MSEEEFEVHVEINKDAIVQRKINWITEHDKVISIKKGEKIKIIGRNCEEYYFLCEYNGNQFTCCDVIETSQEWKSSGNPDTDVFINYI